MIIVTYDIKSDRLRGQLASLLEKYGYRLQYSVFKIKNSPRIINILVEEIRHRFEKKFSQSDSVLIFSYSQSSTDKLIKFGYAKNMDQDVIMA